MAEVSRATATRRRQDRAWLSISAAARALGVSPSTLRLWASEGRVPHVRTAGGHRRFNPDILREWLATQPGRSTGDGPVRAERVRPSPAIAQALIGQADRVAQVAEDMMDGPAGQAFRRLSPAERRQAALDWLHALAVAFRTGSIADGLERAEAYGRAHGLARSSAELTLAGSLAMERAVEVALAEAPDPLAPEDRRRAAAALQRLTVRIAEAWADASPEPARRSVPA
ncbi:MAG: helix-turn-helix domain-containing protein [Thermoleophilia bacterium]|jgi:excisionase family DNA binding protein|nr:helix-turn-helix domain-containing protein [Thermoleophilia bacterium]